MDITNLNQENFADLFAGQGDEGKQNGTVHFGLDPELGKTDIFNNTKVDQDSTDPGNAGSSTDATNLTGEGTDDNQQDSQNAQGGQDDKNTDILGTEGKNTQTKQDKPVDISSYFEDRIKAGKFVKIEEDGEDGQKKMFIPKTPEEFDEVIDIQINHQIEKRKKELEESWYKTKSPAWKAVAKYAEMTDDPADILPFIQGVRNIDSVETLDPADPVAAEQIVRARLEQRGDNQEIIDEQIEALKSTAKLTSTAQKYKPLILQEEKAQLAAMVQQRQEEEREYQKMVLDVRDKALAAIEEPIYGKQKLTQEEKAALYRLIAIPSEENKGYAIFNKIDELFDKGDFTTLSQVALLISNKEAFMKYVTAGAADKTAEGLQRKLRVATDSRTGSGNNGNEGSDTKTGTVQRNQYSTVPKFGRG